MSCKLSLPKGCDLRIIWSHTCTFPHIGIEVDNAMKFNWRKRVSLCLPFPICTEKNITTAAGLVGSSFARNALLHSLFLLCNIDWVLSPTPFPLLRYLTPNAHRSCFPFVFYGTYMNVRVTSSKGTCFVIYCFQCGSSHVLSLRQSLLRLHECNFVEKRIDFFCKWQGSLSTETFTTMNAMHTSFAVCMLSCPQPRCVVPQWSRANKLKHVLPRVPLLHPQYTLCTKFLGHSHFLKQ